MKSTRERILQTLLNNPRSSINDLAAVVGINAISVRHHLTNLQAEGTVAAEEERHGVGRPRLVYFLTEKGLERFPTRYLTLTNRLLSQIKETLPQPAVNQLFTKMAQELVGEHAQKIRSMPMEQKLETIKEVLLNEGFTVEWDKDGNTYQIHEISCPYYHIGQNHPEICIVDQAFISGMLSIPVEKVSCILRGDRYCTYVIPESTTKESEK
ncbi:MAG: winged helix-turn-helix transcriptional regulator [Anaerolineaceae bacterium]|nr:winged helix-turn-helix transcriptional regulator [Anaerolineaceae bacterium]